MSPELALKTDQIVAKQGSKMSQLNRNEQGFFTPVALNSVPYPQVNNRQIKRMKWTYRKTIDKFPAPHLAMQVVLRARKFIFNDHSRSNTIQFLLNYLNSNHL